MKLIIQKPFLLGIAALLVLLIPATANAQGTLFVEGNNVGIGVSTPGVSLDIEGADSGSSNRIKVHNTSGTTTNRTLFELVNDNGGAQFFLTSGSLGASWQFSNTSVGFIASLVGSGGSEFTIQADGRVIMGPGSQTEFNLAPNGNLTIGGTLTQNSSRAVKRDFSPTDRREILAKVNELPVMSWNYKDDDPSVRHLGPMAEDFHAAFGLGADEKGISTLDTSGVALAAIQGLTDLIEEKDSRIGSLERENQELEQRLAEIERLVAAIAED